MYQKIRKPIVISTAILFHLLLIFHLFFSPVIIVFAAYHSVGNASFIDALGRKSQGGIRFWGVPDIQ